MSKGDGDKTVSVKLINPSEVKGDSAFLSSSPASTGPQQQQQKQQQKLVVGPPSSPCLVSGFYSAFSAGMLGFFFGAIPSMAKNHTLAARSLWAADGWKSAQALALVSGMYTWIHCLCQRIRMKEDGINRGAAGCATGLVLGWKGGPASALQSCAGFGFISYILDFGGNNDTPPAKAGVLSSSNGGICNGSMCSNECSSSGSGGCLAGELGVVACPAGLQTPPVGR